MMMLSPVLAAGYFIVKSKIKRGILLVSIIATFVGIIVTLSKSAWIGFIITYPMFFTSVMMFFKGKKEIFRKKIIIISLSGIVCIILALNFYRMFAGEMGGISNLFKPYPIVSYLDPSTEAIKSPIIKNFYYFLGHERTILWRESIKIFLSDPFKGYGINYFPVKGMPGVHNSFLRVMLASGIIGTMFYLLGWILIFICLIKKIKRVSDWRLKVFYIAIFWSFVSWQIQGLSQTLINNYIIWLFIAISFLDPSVFSMGDNE